MGSLCSSSSTSTQMDDVHASGFLSQQKKPKLRKALIFSKRPITPANPARTGRSQKRAQGKKFKLWHCYSHWPLEKKWALPLGNAQILWRISHSDREFILRWKTIMSPWIINSFCQGQFNVFDPAPQKLIPNWFHNNCVKGDYFFSHFSGRSSEIAMTHWPLEMSMSFTMYIEAAIKWSRQEIPTCLLTAVGGTSSS